MPSQRAEQLIPIEGFNLGGLADSKFSGIKNSVYKMVGFDPHSTPGLLKVEQKLTKNSAATVTELCKHALTLTTGDTLWFSGTSGKIWHRAAAGTWSLCHTTTPTSGGTPCLGAFEYQGYVYWATESYLHRIASADADSSWSGDVVEDWAKFLITDAAYHPMVEQNNVLYVGDGRYLAQVDTGVFSGLALDIKAPRRISALGKLGTTVLIGTYNGADIVKTEVIRWNTVSVNFAVSDPVDEEGINVFMAGDSIVFVQAGLRGNIYTYNGQALELYKKIPGEFTSAKYGQVYPGAVANIGGNILFGFSNGSGDPADEGIYRIGRAARNYPYILDFPYPTSQRDGANFILTGTTIGAVLVDGHDLYVAWKEDTNYGVDKLDASNKLSKGYLETRVMSATREPFSVFSKFLIAYESLPASTNIEILYDKNYTGSYAATTEIKDTARKLIYAEEGVEANTLQLKLLVTSSSNSAPTIERAVVFLR